MRSFRPWARLPSASWNMPDRPADQAVGEDRGHRLVIAGPAPVKPAVLLDQLEGIAHPVLALGFHHIDVREQQDRLGPAILAAGWQAMRHPRAEPVPRSCA